VKNIDFLPDIYRQRSAQQQARLWWLAVVLIFGAAIGAASSVQLALRRSVQSQLAELEPQSVSAQQLALQLASVQSQISVPAHSAALYSYLKHPWPRSQVLATLVAPLPATVRLSEIKLSEQASPTASASENAEHSTGNAPADATAAKLSPAESDLAQLRQQQDSLQVVIDVTGFATDVSELHQYINELGRSRLVGSAQLKSLAKLTSDDRTTQTRFDVQLILRPGYGQPGAPDSPTPESLAKQGRQTNEERAR